MQDHRHKRAVGISPAGDEMDISITGRKAKLRPIMDRAERERIIRANQIEVAAYRVLDEEEERAALCPANDNVAPPDAEVVAKTGPRTIKSFHRLYSEGLLHPTDNAVNNALYQIGGWYRRHYFQAGGTATRPPPSYVAPEKQYDSRLQTEIAPPPARAVLYHDAAKVLDALEIREVFEAIVVHDRPIVPVGQQYTGRKHPQNARGAVAAVVRIGLIRLRSHYSE
jgi:hypothetical protein